MGIWAGQILYGPVICRTLKGPCYVVCLTYIEGITCMYSQTVSSWGPARSFARLRRARKPSLQTFRFSWFPSSRPSPGTSISMSQLCWVENNRHPPMPVCLAATQEGARRKDRLR